MKCALAICVSMVLGGATPVIAGTQASAPEPEGRQPPGKRLRVEFVETRLQGERTTGSRRSSVVLNADAESARLFLGTQVALTTQDRGLSTTQFKNAGSEVRVRAETRPDGRFRLDAAFERTVVRATDHDTAGTNPILLVARGAARLTLREGETVPFASAVDPITGEQIRVDVTLAAAAAPRAAPAASAGSGLRLRATYVLVRRQGARTTARRPYSVVLDEGSAEPANVFSGSMLPVQAVAQGQPTVMLKDVGAGLRLTSLRAALDGSYELDVSFSDGILTPGKDGAPEVRAFQSESTVLVYPGDTVAIASTTDPQTGEVVEAELTVDVVR